MAGPGRPRKNQEIYNHQSENTESHPDSLQEEIIATPDEETQASEPEDASPVDEKISLVSEEIEKGKQESLNNWDPISTAPRNGFPIRVTDDFENPGVIAFWRKSRAFANATHRWEECGFWTDSSTGRNINFTALWWKDRNIS